jgi:integrase
MATLSAKVFKHHKKTDGTYNVKIVLYHKKQVYIDTQHFVVDRQLTKSFKIKDQFIIAQLEATLSTYRKAISDLGGKIESFSAESLKEHLIAKGIKVDFLKFADTYIKELRSKEETEKTGANFNTVRNHLIDFNYYKQELPIEFISVEFISRFEKFLRNERIMLRKDQFGREYKKKGRPLPDSSVHIYLRDFQALFSAAIKKYNRPSLELIPIKFNPFEEYAIVAAPEPKERKLAIDQLKIIRDANVVKGGREELAKNLGLLSFYLCGMNAIDFFKKKYAIKNGRIEYCRSKTAGRRKDKAFISIKIPDEARGLLEFAEALPNRYTTNGGLNKALSKGMAALSKNTKIDHLEFYKFRHAFGDLAGNACRRPTKDVALALNHVEQGFKTTNMYIPKDWRIVDEVQEGVLKLLRPKNCSQTSYDFKDNTRVLLNYIQTTSLSK